VEVGDDETEPLGVLDADPVGVTDAPNEMLAVMDDEAVMLAVRLVVGVELPVAVVVAVNEDDRVASGVAGRMAAFAGGIATE
jgi:hypothetical protein